jgi:tetratricopeptide (TPR) repeat protein
MTNLFWEMGEQDHAIESGLRALAIADSRHDGALRDMAHRYLGRSYHAIGDYRRAIEVFTKIVGPAGSRLSPIAASGSVIQTRVFLMLCLAEVGQFAEAILYGEEALAIASAVDNQFNSCALEAALGRVHVHRGNFSKAALLLENALEICKSANIPLLFPFRCISTRRLLSRARTYQGCAAAA